MAQYRTGTVTVTNSDATVAGVGTSWLTNLSVGDIFIRIGDSVQYFVGSITNDTELELTAPYVGVTGSGVSYAVTTDFTPNSALGLLSPTDLETAITFNANMTAIDEELADRPTNENLIADTIAGLRNIEPVVENQVITLIGHTVAGVGGGTFFFDNSDLSAEVAADPSGGVYVGIPSDPTGASGAWVRKDKDFVTPQMFGALEDGVTDSTSEIEENISRYSNSVISGDISYDLSISNATTDNNYALAYFRKIFSGIRTATGRALSGKPSVVVEKHSAADTSATNLQDNGFVVSCSKKDDVSGSGMRAFYAYVEQLVGDGGSIAIHGRARTTNSDARIWGGWFYADRASTTLTRTIGTEVNVRNNTADAPYDDSLVGGGVDGLVSATVDSTYICNNSIVVTASSGGGWRTGVRVRADSIAPEVAGEGEAHLVRGATSSGNKYGGFKFLDGNFTYGTKYNGPTYENKAAIWMAKDDKIVFGDTTSASTWFTYTASNVFEIKGNALDFQLSSGTPLRINGDSGATGTFTTTDGKTVTVTGGLITTIA